MFLCRSPSLLWPQSMRIEMLMWHYEWEVRTIQLLWTRGLWGDWNVCIQYSECRQRMFPQTALRNSPGTGGPFIYVQFWKTTWHPYNGMQMYSPIPCQWLLRFPRQSIQILINRDYKLSNLEKNGLSLKEKPWSVFFKLQKKVFKLFSVSIYPRQMLATVTFLFSALLCPTLLLPSHRNVTHSDAQIKWHLLYEAFLDFLHPTQAQLITDFAWTPLFRSL